MTGSDDRPRWWCGSRFFLSGAAVLAVAAAAVLAVGSDDPRLLRLGIVAALWAAMLRAFAVVRVRQEAGQEGEREAMSGAEFAALRAELHSLRNTLRDLLSGDLLVERVALRAESTRVRPLPERPPSAHFAGDSLVRAVIDRGGLPEPRSDELPAYSARHSMRSEQTGTGPRSVDQLLAAHGPRHPLVGHRRRRPDDAM